MNYHNTATNYQPHHVHLNHIGSPLLEVITWAIDMASFTIYQNANSQPSPASFILFHEMSTIAMTGSWIRIFKDGPLWSTHYF